MNWFTSDHHFGHAKIVSMCNRPYSGVEEMDEDYARKWNSVVQNRDDVYILGDFCWKACRANHFISALNGKKHLVLGNHDKLPQDVLRNFSSVTQILQKSFDGRMVVMCHFPLRSWNGKCYGSYHLYGHVHGRTNNNRLMKSLDVGVDSWNGYPVPWETIDNVLKSDCVWQPD